MVYNGEIIKSNGIKNYSLKTFTWKLIDVCNQKCAYCLEGFGSDEFRPKSSFFKDESQINSYSTVLKILKLKSLGNFEVDIIGGEPTLHPHIYEIIETLNKLPNCKQTSILTNLKKSFSFFEKFNDEKYNKLLWCPSIHFEYYTPELLEKCILMHSFEHTEIIPIIMLHDNPKHWDNMETFINGLIEHNIEYTISFINSYCGYTVNYTPEFYSRFSKFFMYDDSEYIFNDKLLLDKYDIHSNHLMKFTGWKCKPLRYVIKHTGEISNACTGKALSFINNDSFITCGVNICDCDTQWNYEKYKQ